jgi:hypothetical protein
MNIVFGNPKYHLRVIVEINFLDVAEIHLRG